MTTFVMQAGGGVGSVAALELRPTQGRQLHRRSCMDAPRSARPIPLYAVRTVTIQAEKQTCDDLGKLLLYYTLLSTDSQLPGTCPRTAAHDPNAVLKHGQCN